MPPRSREYCFIVQSQQFSGGVISESFLFFVLWSQNRHLWGIGYLPRDHSALGGESSANRKCALSSALFRRVEVPLALK